MSEFQTPIDVANRACFHWGVRSIDRTLGFNETSKQASVAGELYDKMRRAELERNRWRFAIRSAVLRPLDASTMKLSPALWVADTTYFVGMVVSYDGMPWICRAADSTGAQPNLSADWQLYFGPRTVSLYSSTTTYQAGELVYTAAGDGTNRVYLSLQGDNADNPATATAWDATATYFKDDVVTRTSVAYLSLIDLNVNQDPALAPALWSSGTTYSIGDQVGASDGVIYTSLTNSNTGNDPTTDVVNWQTTGTLNPWTTVFTGGSGSVKWRQIGGAEFPSGVGLTPIRQLYPVGAGPSSQTWTRNVFFLPAGYVRRAPQAPKAGAWSMLGAPTNRVYEDWNFQDDYFTSHDVNQINFRFVANMTDVAQMTTMFCELLGLRIALEGVERVTQSAEKAREIAGKYHKFGDGDARMTNAIELDPVEEPLDDYLACRA